MERDATAIDPMEENYYYQKGYQVGYYEGQRKALENIPNVIKYATQPHIIVMTEEQIEKFKKQIPKKPTHQATLPRDFTCPSCLNVQREKAPYCQFCGQKLDWED